MCIIYIYMKSHHLSVFSCPHSLECDQVNLDQDKTGRDLLAAIERQKYISG